jgi:hypothetical protein
MIMSHGDAHFYSAYGLKIKSAVKLPGFVELQSIEYPKIDVEISHKKITQRVLERLFGTTDTFSAPDCEVRVTETAMCFSYPKTGTILVTDGKRVIVDLQPDVYDEDLVPYLTGYVLAVLLHQRNYLVLHASVIMINGNGVAFLGAKGQGKSTLAASLEVIGNRLISDDLLPIVVEGNRIFTVPGYPQIKLYEDSVIAVGEVPSQLPAVHRNNSKYSFSCKQFSEDTIPLSAIYVLNIDDEISIESLSMSQAFIEATKHTHVSYYLRESESLEWHFEKCQQLVHSVPFFWFNRPHDFGKIHEGVNILKKHFDNVVGKQAGSH